MNPVSRRMLEPITRPFQSRLTVKTEHSSPRCGTIISQLPGETFTPFRKLWGIYWPDVVGRRKGLSDGRKRLYERFDDEFERKWGSTQPNGTRQPVTTSERKNGENLSGTRGAWNSVITELGSKKPSSSSERTADKCTMPLNSEVPDDEDACSVEQVNSTSYQGATWLNGDPISLSELHACKQAIQRELGYDHALHKPRPEDFALPDDEITVEIAGKYTLGPEDFAHWLDHFRGERKNLRIRH